MSILKTTQTIKVKVTANGGLQPLSSAPVILKNTVREDILLSQLGDVVANTAANGAYLVYNAAINKYEVKVITASLNDISNFDSAPGGVVASNGDVITFNQQTGNYEVKPININLATISDVNATSPADGFLLVYNANTSKYDVREVVTNVGNLGDVVGTPVDGSTLVYNATTGKYDIKVLESLPSIDGSITPLKIKFTDQAMPLGIANGELAYSNSSIALYIGDGGIPKILGGEKFIFVQRATPGILSSNAVLVADSNSFINTVKTENLIVGNNVANADLYTTIQRISNFANSTQLGSTSYGSNNELVTSAAIKTYVDESLAGISTGGGGSSYVLPIANSSTLGGFKVGSGLTIDSITGVLSTTGGGGGGGGYTLPIASPGTLGGIKIGSGLVIDDEGTVSVPGPGGTIGVTAEDARDQAAGLLTNGTHSGITFVYDDAANRINATVTATGGGGANNLNALADVTLSDIVNNSIIVYNGASSQWKNYSVTGTSNGINVSFTGNNLSIGLSNNVVVSSNLYVNQHILVTNTATFSNNVTISGTLQAYRSANVAESLNVAGNTSLGGNTTIAGGLVVSNNVTFSNNLSVSNTLYVAKQVTFANTTLIHGALTVNNSAQINSNLAVTNVITTSNLVTNNITAISFANLGVTNVRGNTTIGTSSADKLIINAELASNVIPDANNMYSLGTPERRFKDLYVSGGTIFVDDLQMSSPPGGGLLVAGQLTVAGNVSVVGNTTLTGVATITDSTSLLANVSLGSTHTDKLRINAGVATNILPHANSINNLGNAELYFANTYTQSLIARDGTFAGNVQISGDFTVLGNVTSLSVQTMDVEDPLIKLAGNNNSDSVDIGFYGKYTSSGNVEYTGLMRDATDGKYKLFGSQQEPTTIVDTDNATYHYKTLVSYIESGGLISNATSVRISSNSSVNVNIIANTLSLSTPLGVVSGGTGRSSITNNAIVVGNGTSALTELMGSEGQILQIKNGVPTFAHIDCGYF